MVISVNNNGTLNIKTDNFSHTTGSTVGATYSQKSNKAMEAVFKHIEDNAAKIGEDKKLKAALVQSLPEFETLAGSTKDNAASLKRLKAALEFKAGATTEATTAGLIKTPLARKMLSEKALKDMGITDLKELDGFIAAKDKIAGYAKDVKANKDGIRKIIIEHSGQDEAILEAVFGKHKDKFKDVAEDLGKEMTKAVEKMDAAHLRITEFDKQLQDPALTGKALKRVESLRAKEVEKMAKATAGKDFTGKLFEAIEKENPKLLEELKDIDTSIETHIESAIKTGSSATKAAETGGNKWYSVFHGENALKDIAKKEGVAVEKLGLLKKIRPGKTAAIAGIAAVGTYFIASMGNKGPAERAEATGKAAEPSMAGGRSA